MIKIRLFITLLLFVFQIGFSQNEKSINGTILCNNLPVQGVEVVNAVSKKTTISDSQGNFSILVKAKDILVFVSKIYDFKNILLEQEAIDKNNFTISLTKKPEELEEIIIRQTAKIDWKLDTKWEQIKRDEITAERDEKRLKNTRIDDLTIDKGLNLARIGEMLFGPSKKEPDNNKLPKNEFKELARTTCDQKFYLQTLKLKLEEIELFLEFCDADPKSKTVAESNNVLSVMDFLLAKNVEFKKL